MAQRPAILKNAVLRLELDPDKIVLIDLNRPEQRFEYRENGNILFFNELDALATHFSPKAKNYIKKYIADEVIQVFSQIDQACPGSTGHANGFLNGKHYRLPGVDTNYRLGMKIVEHEKRYDLLEENSALEVKPFLESYSYDDWPAFLHLGIERFNKRYVQEFLFDPYRMVDLIIRCIIGGDFTFVFDPYKNPEQKYFFMSVPRKNRIVLYTIYGRLSLTYDRFLIDLCHLIFSYMKSLERKKRHTANVFTAAFLFRHFQDYDAKLDRHGKVELERILRLAKDVYKLPMEELFCEDVSFYLAVGLEDKIGSTAEEYAGPKDLSPKYRLMLQRFASALAMSETALFETLKFDRDFGMSDRFSDRIAYRG